MEDIERYVLNSMPPDEKQAFDRELARDALLREEVGRILSLLEGNQPQTSERYHHILNLLKNEESDLPPLTEEELENSGD